MGFGVSVHILEPQVFKTQLAPPDVLSAKIDELWAQASEETRQEYGNLFHEKSTFGLMLESHTDIGNTSFTHAVTLGETFRLNPASFTYRP